jgi:hypothetical protein
VGFALGTGFMSPFFVRMGYSLYISRIACNERLTLLIDCPFSLSLLSSSPLCFILVEGTMCERLAYNLSEETVFR